MSYQQRNSFAHMVSIGPRCQFHIFNGLTRNFGANSLTPKSFWPVTHKAVLSFGFFFFTFSFPPITNCWRGVIVHLCEFLSPFPWCKCRPCCKGVTSRSVCRPQWVGHLCSLLEITNQSYRATLTRRCLSHHPPPSPSLPPFLVHTAKIAELSFVLGQTDRQITWVCLVVLCLQAMTGHVRPSGWRVFLLTLPCLDLWGMWSTQNTQGRENGCGCCVAAGNQALPRHAVKASLISVL